LYWLLYIHYIFRANFAEGVRDVTYFISVIYVILRVSVGVLNRKTQEDGGKIVGMNGEEGKKNKKIAKIFCMEF